MFKHRQKFAVATVLAAMVLVVLNTAIANVALPTIANSLSVTPGLSIWVITAYQTGLLIALLPCAALGESWGYRRIFTIGVALFTIATLLCALAPTLPWLIAARFLQGLGGAAVMALGIALLRNIIPPQQLGAAIGWNALAVALSSAIGPVLCAGILSIASWPWLFTTLLPLGALVLISTRTLPTDQGTAQQIDLCSVGLNAGAFISLVFAAEFLADRPVLVILLVITSGLQFTALVKRELPKKIPLIPLDLLKINTFQSSVIASVLCFSGQTAGIVALPFYLQHNLGLEMLMVGIFMIPWPLAVALTASLTSHLAERWSTAALCSIGGGTLATGLAAISLWPTKSDPALLFPFTVICGLGFGLFNVANNRSMFFSAPINRSGAAGGMQGVARLFGQTAGAVIMTMLFTVFSKEAVPQIGLGIGAVLALLAALVSVSTIKRKNDRRV